MGRFFKRKQKVNKRLVDFLGFTMVAVIALFSLIYLLTKLFLSVIDSFFIGAFFIKINFSIQYL